MTIDYDAFMDDLLITDGDTLGEMVTYLPSGGQGKSIKGSFEKSYLAVQEIGEVGVSSSSPMLLCKTSDVEDAARGDTVIIRGDTYNVTEVQDDGDGMTTLILSLDA